MWDTVIIYLLPDTILLIQQQNCLGGLRRNVIGLSIKWDITDQLEKCWSVEWWVCLMSFAKEALSHLTHRITVELPSLSDETIWPQWTCSRKKISNKCGQDLPWWPESGYRDISPLLVFILEEETCSWLHAYLKWRN